MAMKELKTVKFWLVFVSMIFVVAIPVFMINYFKVYCLVYYTDQTATNFTPVATIAILFGRFMFGQLIDNYGYKKYVIVHYLSQILAMIFLYFFIADLPIFYIAFFINYA